MEGKPVKLSYVETTEIVQPFHSNVYGQLFGGHLMELVDNTAGIAAYRHSGTMVVTVSVDNLVFKSPAPVGSILTIKAGVNRVFKSSMEVGVRVTALRPDTGEKTLVCPAYLTFVALDVHGNPTEIPPVIPESADEIRRYENAAIRRQARLELAAKINYKEPK